MSNFTALDSSSAVAWLQGNDGIIIFHKKLCPNCKVMHTVLQKVLLQEPELRLAAVDTEEQPELLAEFGVERAPTLLVCKKGEVKERKTGLLNPAELLAFYRQA